MAIGPLEYLVIGLQDHHSTSEILPELNAIQENGHIQVLDLLFVNKAVDGTVTLQEINELSEEEQQLPGPAVSTDNGKLAQLQLLGKLHESGVLTDDEFEREKQQILNS